MCAAAKGPKARTPCHGPWATRHMQERVGERLGSRTDVRSGGTPHSLRRPGCVGPRSGHSAVDACAWLCLERKPFSKPHPLSPSHQKQQLAGLRAAQWHLLRNHPGLGAPRAQSSPRRHASDHPALRTMGVSGPPGCDCAQGAESTRQVGPSPRRPRLPLLGPAGVQPGPLSPPAHLAAVPPTPPG